MCSGSLDHTFNAGYGVDGDYPWKFPNNNDTGFAPQVRALAVWDDGSGPALYVGGTFKQAGGIPANFIAKFDGGAGAPRLGGRGGGMDSFVHALAVYDDGSGSALYAGGTSRPSTARASRGIAKWNGSSWSAVGGGIAGTGVLALAVWNNALYAGGQLGPAGAVRCATWRGGTAALVDARNGPRHVGQHGLRAHRAQAPVGLGTALWAGGDFTVSRFGGDEARGGLGRHSWTEVGGGVGTGPDDYSGFFNVSSLGVYKSELYAGGWFKAPAGRQRVGHRRRPLGWPEVERGREHGRTGYLLQEPMGVQTLSVFNDGTGDALYALGVLAGLTPRRDVLRWNGSAGGQRQRPVGPEARRHGAARLGRSDRRRAGEAVRRIGDVLLVASRQEVKGLATWDGAAWRPLGQGSAMQTHALAVFDAGSGAALYAGGNHVKRMGRVAPPASMSRPGPSCPTCSRAPSTTPSGPHGARHGQRAGALRGLGSSPLPAHGRHLRRALGRRIVGAARQEPRRQQHHRRARHPRLDDVRCSRRPSRRRRRQHRHRRRRRLRQHRAVGRRHLAPPSAPA